MIEKKCLSCKVESFKDEEGNCQPCVEGCEVCLGPSAAQCLVIKSSYFFDRQSKTFKACPQGCSSCDAKGQCIRCQLGYIQSVKLNAKGESKTDHNHEIVECKRCKDENCQFCQVDGLGNEVCSSCEPGFGMHAKEKICKPCSEGCLTCALDRSVCNFCKDGYEKTPGSHQCKPISIPNCINEDIANEKCLWCKTGFTPNPSNNGSDCASCYFTDPLCSYCRKKTEKDTFNVTNKLNLVCVGCATGYVLETNNSCGYCGDFCNYCNANKTCFSCNWGYTLLNNTCQKSSLPHCDIPNNNGKGCAACMSGFYLEEGDNTCKRCHESCLLCSGPKEDDCTACGASKFALKSEASVLFGLFGYEKQQCVDTCPHKANGKQLVEDSLVGECVPIDEKMMRPTSKYPFKRTHADKMTWESLYQDSQHFLKDFVKYVEHNVVSAKKWASENSRDAAKYSHHCNYRGELHERMSVSRGTYYHCICIKGMHGSNCHVDRELFKAIQEFLARFTKDIARHENTIDEKLMFLTVTNLAQVPMSIISLNQLTLEFTNMIAKSKRFKINHMTEFLLALDGLMKAFYDEKTELEDRADDFKNDIGYSDFMSQMYRQLHHMIRLGDDVVRSSLDHIDSAYFDVMTQAFQVTNYQAINDTFKGDDEFYLLPTNIRSTSDLQGATQVIIRNKFLDSIYAKVKVIAWAYSRLLFPATLRYASHLVQIYPVEVKAHGSFYLNPKFEEDDYVEITFPLKVSAAELKFKRDMSCTAIKFGGGGDTFHIAYEDETGELIKTVEDEGGIQYAVCRFKNKLVGFYFSVTYKQEITTLFHMAVNDELLTADSQFELKITSRPAHDYGSMASISLATWTALILAISWIIV